MGLGSDAVKRSRPASALPTRSNPKTVIRAGYGRSFDLGVFGSIFGHTATQNLPILTNQSIPQAGGPNSSAFALATGAGLPPVTPVPASGLLPNPGFNVNSKARPNPLRLPTIDAWNLSIQRSITPTLSVTIAYVGNKGTHTLSAGDGNSTNPNEPGIFLPAQYSINGQALHYTTPGRGTGSGKRSAGSSSASTQTTERITRRCCSAITVASCLPAAIPTTSGRTNCRSACRERAVGTRVSNSTAIRSGHALQCPAGHRVEAIDQGAVVHLQLCMAALDELRRRLLHLDQAGAERPRRLHSASSRRCSTAPTSCPSDAISSLPPMFQES